MKKFKSRLKNQGGFTLVEMLIVVAIIAILVAVSIPLVNSSLEKARIATDAANERAAKMAVTVEFLTNGSTAAGTYDYDAVKGIAGKGITPTGYGKCADHKGEYVQVDLAADGTCTIKWSGDTGASSAHGIPAE